MQAANFFEEHHCCGERELGAQRDFTPLEGDPLAAPQCWSLAEQGCVLFVPEQLAMRRRRQGDNEVFGMSFLDVISCGFAAMVAILMLAKRAPDQIPLRRLLCL